MQIVIDIPEEIYKASQIIDVKYEDVIQIPLEVIANGTPIPDNATNGDTIEAMFDVKKVDMCNTYCVHFPEEENYSHYFFKEWWNALYKAKNEDDKNERD